MDLGIYFGTKRLKDQPFNFKELSKNIAQKANFASLLSRP